jgi:hypothetical protein
MDDMDFKMKVVESLGKLENGMKDLLGNGQPGRIQKIEVDLKAHDRSLSSAKGWVAGVLGVLGVALSIFEWYFHLRGSH